jgi:yeast amino acid transporter
MAAINPHYASSDSHSQEKKEYPQEVNIAGAETWEEDSNHHLHRGLKARQITMIVIGGAIGTSLIIGTSV